MNRPSDFFIILDLDVAYRLDEGFKASSYLTETLLDPEFGHAFEANKTAFNKAYNVKVDQWTWFEAPGNRLRLTRFGAAMNGVKNMSPVETILEGSFRTRHAWLLYTIISRLKHLQGTPGGSSLRAH
jgi:hypothetical protein